jgi:ABC-type nickel/cobalt efflux system permease component RcnA
MLVLVSSYRLFLFARDEQTTVNFHKHRHQHAGVNQHLHTHVHPTRKHLHKTAYGVGFVHGLAGSGALVVLVMTQIETITNSLLYLVLFGTGSIAGMTLVAGVFSIPFSKKLTHSNTVKTTLVLLSSILCFAYGCYVIYRNLYLTPDSGI